MGVEQYIRSGGKSGIGHLMVEMPPRHGKSQSISRLFPAWFLGRNPNARIIIASYGASLSEGHSRYVRAAIRSNVFRSIFPRVHLSDDSAAKDVWDLASPHEGGMIAVGLNGAMTGKGGHLIVIDDPVKGRKEAESQLMRDNVWNWYTDDLSTRLEPGGAIINVMTRWHQDDLHGRLMLNSPEGITRLTLPAIAEKKDPMGRRPGEALWPERYPIAVLEKQRGLMAGYSFDAEYQQSPTPASGGLFKRHQFQIIEHEPADIVRRVRFWDLALSENESADFTVGLLLGLTKAGYLVVLDVRRFQKEWDEVPGMIAKIMLADGKGVAVGIENAYFQSRAVKSLLKKPELFGFNVKGYRPDGDKYTRALPFAARCGEKLVAVMRKTWTEDYLGEMTAFPVGGHDDQVDASSGALLMLEERRTLTVETSHYA